MSRARAGDVIDRRNRIRKKAGGSAVGAGSSRGGAARIGTKAQVSGAPAVRWVAFGFSVALAGLGFRLYQLQITQHSQFAVQAASNFQRDEVIPALRGEIRTRDGVLLATNRVAVDLIYTGRRDPEDPVQAIPAWDKIVYLAGIQPDVLIGGQPREPDRNKETETILARNIPQEKLSALYEYTVLIPSLELRERVERVYPENKLAAHALGYVLEANEEQVKEGNYTVGDLVGVSGLEYSLQQTLQGKNGLRRREVTANGKPQTERVLNPGQKGQDVTLTIDSTLQRAAEQVLREGLADVNAGRQKYGQPPEPLTRGAVIAIDPRTNEVLAMASSPTFDPNWFSRVPSPDNAAKTAALMSSSVDAVMQNRVVQTFDAGSVFKPASTLAYIERWGNKTFNCLPSIRYGGPRYNWHRSGSLGNVDGRLAIAFSCNTWYYQAAIDADPITYANYLGKRAGELGYGRPTGLELVGEKSGYLPTPINFAEMYKTTNLRRAAAGEEPLRYYPGQALSFAIGQDSLLVTPAQVTSVLSTIVNEGKRRPLTLVKAVGGKLSPHPLPEQVPGKQADFRIVKEGMNITTAGTTRWGTAQHILGPQWFPVRTAGKTGTAENGLSFRKGYAYTNAWYEGYGPIDSPNFMVVSFFQNGGEGSGPALNATAKMFAARWCLTLDERHHATGPQQPCMGELENMHKVMKIRAQRAAATAAKGTEQ